MHLTHNNRDKIQMKFGKTAKTSKERRPKVINKNKFLIVSSINPFGGSMHRWFRLSTLLALFVLATGVSVAQLPVKDVAGRIAQNDVRIFVRDTLYRISGPYIVAGSLVIEPGTTVEFLPNGRLIDSVGGRIIADGRARANYSGTNYTNVFRPTGALAYDYSDPAYFMSNAAVSVSSQIEPTIHSAKRDVTFNVVLDTLARKIENLPAPLAAPAVPGSVYPSWPIAINPDPLNPGANPTLPPNTYVPTFASPFVAATVMNGTSYYNTKFVVTYEQALLWIAARLSDPTSDPAIRTLQWRRVGRRDSCATAVNIGGVICGNRAVDRIRFVGKAINNFSREWGHMIVLPGARTAFFRDCDFENFRKDTTVDRVDIYQGTGGSASAPGTLNFNLVSSTQGSGGVLSILSSRTWMVNCNFKKNMARYHGGAVQFLQAPVAPTGQTQYPATLTTGTAANNQYLALPASYQPADLGNSVGTGPIIVNQYLFEQNTSNTSTLLPAPRINSDPNNMLYVRAHDNLYYPTLKEMDDQNRQLIDDGRLAVYLGRIRQLTFTENKVLNANIKQVVTSLGVIVTDDDSSAATIETNANRLFKNQAYGGAVYMSGRWGIDIGLGVNDFQGRDFVIFDGNKTQNHQPEQTSGVSTGGSKGGAIYVTGFTSLVTTGRYRSNMTETKFITNTYNSAALNQGGAVYMAATAGRLMLRGGQDVQVPMYMTSNKSDRGGAIYVDENFSSDPNRPSPHIGGNNVNNIQVRNLGYNIKLQNNTATYDGGAIFTKRNYLMYGAGGVVSNVILGYTSAHLLELSGNIAGYSGGAVATHMRSGVTEPERGYIRVVRAIFDNNRVGENIDTSAAAKNSVRGGGALYALNAELQTIQGVRFNNNLAQWGNGGAIALINPRPSFTTSGSATGNFQRVFATDLDVVTYGSNPAFVTGFQSVNDPFTFNPNSAYPPHVNMLTRFLDNRAVENSARMGSGATQAGNITLRHPGTGVTTGPDAGIGGTQLQENGTGLGGAVYILDEITAARAGRLDSIFFNRVRFQNQSAYSGAAVYSDNYDLKLVMLRSFVANNTATSNVGATQNGITGPMITLGTTTYNAASSDLAGAIIYGEAIGPVPQASYSTAGNSMYDNNARFLIRVPDAPNTKGVLAGTTGIGYGGVDTLRGNYWGRTEANVTTKVYRYDTSGNPADSVYQETFFWAGDGTQQLRFMRGGSGKDQGPFESPLRYNYTPIPVLNGANESTVNTASIPEKLLQQGRVYDSYDKGTDIKLLDYASRRMSPIEDFAVGIPTLLRKYSTVSDAKNPSYNKYIKRWTRNPFVAEVDPNINILQTEFKGDHPIGYPLFLEAQADYSSLDVNISNNDVRSINETVFFVINTSTGDYIRVNMAQLDNTSEVFRARVDIVPDSTNGGQFQSGYQARRNAEGLANFGTDLASILAAIKRNAENEDLGTLQGRKYEASAAGSQLGGSGFSLSNRPTLPASNGGAETYFAGERYNAIPAKAGDNIAIVSRSALWREVGSNNDAFAGALMFRVGTSTPPPVWTGNKLSTALPLQQNGTPVPPIFRNRIFVSEDRVYPRDPSDPNNAGFPGRDTIFAITARDTNLFYNPNAILNPDGFTRLDYGWSVDAGSGLSHWLKADTIKADQTAPLNDWWQAKGYVRLKGQPSNPYIVPGGERVVVTARNFPPTYRTLDSMKAAGVADSVIAKYIYLYPMYFANQQYDGTNARWLQQDTVNYGWNYDTAYTFWIHVTDSLPRIVDIINPCPAPNNAIYANVTDKLRMKFDIQSDDELEDSTADAEGWDFKYGRTSYAFLSKNRNDVGQDTANDQITLVRPHWMRNANFRKYSDPTQADPFATDYTTKGQLYVQIDSAAAIQELSPIYRLHNALNTDTTMTIVVNDGHSGITTMNKRIIVNMMPTIMNTALADAWEDQDYNSDLSKVEPDSMRRIIVSDPNFGQVQKYELIYSDDSRKTAGIPRDGCFPEAGNWDISNASTPKWLKVNDVNGVLYGTPRVLDAKVTDTTVKVTALVTDEGGLTHVKTLDLKINGVNHPPHITSAPNVRCIENGQNFTDTLWVHDIDLRRDETVSGRVISPSGLTLNPSTIDGWKSKDSTQVYLSGTPFNITPYTTSVDVKIEVTDRAGLKDTIVYKINVSEKTEWTAHIVIANNQGGFETLSFGNGKTATTGDNPNLGGIGKLDSNYCEYELPPIPPFDVFDARWIIPSKNGMLRNFFPSCNNGDKKIEIYKGHFQPGGVNGNTSNYIPITFKWKKSEIPAANDAQKNPCGASYFLQDGLGGSLFSINMNTGGYKVIGGSQGNFTVTENGDEITLTIKTDAVSTFNILWDQSTDVTEHPTGDVVENSLLPVTPNPFDNETNINFELVNTSKVMLEVYDNLGNKVATLANGVYPVGRHNIVWDGHSLNNDYVPSGTYTIKLTTGTNSTVQRVVFVR